MIFPDFIRKLQAALNAAGEKLSVDGEVGPKTRAALDGYDVEITVKKKPVKAPAKGVADPNRKAPPWYSFAKKFDGKNENDAEFAAYMVPKWKLVGLNLGTIAKSWAAWCGLAMAVALSGVGVDYAKNGALAKNWATFAHEINWKVDGVPKGAVVQINHVKCGDAANNHVAQANGDCTAAQLLKAGATIDLYGGNQGNTWKNSTFKAATICAVRWPSNSADFPPPGKILTSVNCSSKMPDSKESTL